MTDTMDEFMLGYIDGGDLNAPEPSANRSHSYRHSFAVRRAEMHGKPFPANLSRENATTALLKDLCCD